MSDEPEDLATRARRRARPGLTRREYAGIAAFFTTAGALGLDLLGAIPGISLGVPLVALLGALSHSVRDTLAVPFRRRGRPLLLPGMSSTPLAELANLPEHTHVHVRGRIRALEAMSTYLGAVNDAVYRRLELAGCSSVFGGRDDIHKHLVATRDFLLVDETGAAIEIRMEQAEVQLPGRVLRTHNRHVTSGLFKDFWDKPPPALHWPTVSEHWLAAGDEIEVLGTIAREADPRQEALPRELPTRPVLVSAYGRPLTVRLLRAR